MGMVSRLTVLGMLSICGVCFIGVRNKVSATMIFIRNNLYEKNTSGQTVCLKPKRAFISVIFKADSHIACRAHGVLLPCRALIHTCDAAPLPCSESSVSFVKVRVVAGNIRTASSTVFRPSCL
jgi:hypothetical protein